ncbi:MAG: carbohydrate-binding protein, partial [Saccharofermentanales bacterium]
MNQWKKTVKSVLSIVTISIIFSSVVSAATVSDDKPLKDQLTDIGGNYVEDISQFTLQTYRDIEDTYAEKDYKPAARSEIALNVLEPDASSDPVPVKDGALIWREDIQWIEWNFTIDKQGLYTIAAEYSTADDGGTYAERGLCIDGEIPFAEATNIRFTKIYKDASSPIVNSIGDEVYPRQQEIKGIYQTAFIDNQGLYAQPFRFYFSEGIHTIRISVVNDDLLLYGLYLRSPDNIESYAAVSAEYLSKGFNEAVQTLKFQAESTVTSKNDPTLSSKNDGNPLVEPSSYNSIRLNTIGGYSWRNGNQRISWGFDVPENGLYKISIRIRQQWGDGLPSCRQIQIDNTIPFLEMAEYAFPYNTNWQTHTLSGKSGDDYLFYLSKGEHTISMTVKIGQATEIITKLNECSKVLSKLIRRITLITGNNPDYNYEYELEKNVPNLIDDFDQLIAGTQKCIDLIHQMTSQETSTEN